MDKENFVPVDESKELKDLGYDEPCINHWERGTDGSGWGLFTSGQWLTYKDLILEYKDNEGNICGEFSAPLWQQAFDWFETQYGLYLSRHVLFSTNEMLDMRYFIHSFDGTIEVKFHHNYDEFDRNKARLICLQKLISIVKENGNKGRESKDS